MPGKKTISFVAKPSAGFFDFSLSVGNVILTMIQVNDKEHVGKIKLMTGRWHALSWKLWGDEGTTMAITVKDAKGVEITGASVKETKVHPLTLYRHNDKPFFLT